jgi:hypothetical protein
MLGMYSILSHIVNGRIDTEYQISFPDVSRVLIAFKKMFRIAALQQHRSISDKETENKRGEITIRGTKLSRPSILTPKNTCNVKQACSSI